MPLDSRTLTVLAVTAAAVLAAVLWWRSAQSAPTTSPPSTTTVTTPTSRLPPSGNPTIADQPSSNSGSSVSEATLSPDTSDQAQVDPTPGTTPSAQTRQAREQWRPVILGFARAYSNNQDNPAVWRATLGRYSAPAVSQALADTSPEQAATDSPYVSYDILEHRDDEVAAQVSYADGTATVLYVAQQEAGQSWLVRAFDRLAQ